MPKFVIILFLFCLPMVLAAPQTGGFPPGEWLGKANYFSVDFTATHSTGAWTSNLKNCRLIAEGQNIPWTKDWGKCDGTDQVSTRLRNSNFNPSSYCAESTSNSHFTCNLKGCQDYSNGYTNDCTSRAYKVDLKDPSLSSNITNGLWYKTDITYRVTCSDSGYSGCAGGTGNYQFGCNDGNVCDTLSRTHQSQDNAGNQGQTITVTAKIDKRAPSTTINSNPSSANGDNGWFKTFPTITFSCTDSPGVGCSNTTYCIDQTNSCTPNINYTGSFSIGSFQGTSYVRYRSTDSLGNVESIKTKNYSVDTVAPGVSNNPGLVSLNSTAQRITFTTVSDSTSGVQTYRAKSTLTAQTFDNLTNSYIDAVGIGENTQHSWQIQVKDRAGNWNSYGTASSAKYTNVSGPSTITFGTVAPTSISMTASTFPNPTRGSSGYYFECATSQAGCTSSSWIQTNSYTDTGLTPNTQYSYKEKNRNGDGVETSYSSTYSKYTLANAPGVDSFGTVSSSSIRARWTNNSNPSGTQYYAETCMDSSFTQGCSNSGWFPSEADYELRFTTSGGNNYGNNYIKIHIANSTIVGHMQSDGKDIRIFDHSESFPYTSTQGRLDYWIEKINSSDIILWTTIPNAWNSVTLYMYYGNDDLLIQPLSNITKVFWYADDFSGNMDKWHISSGTIGDFIGIVNGELRVSQDGVSPAKTAQLRSYMPAYDYAIEYKIKTVSLGSGKNLGIGLSRYDRYAYGDGFFPFAYSNNYFRTYKYVYSSNTNSYSWQYQNLFGSWNINEYNKVTIIGTSGGIFSVYLNDVFMSNYSKNLYDSYLVLPRLWEEDTSDSGEQFYDDLRVRDVSHLIPHTMGHEIRLQSDPNLYYDFSGLNPNSLYHFRVKARNSDNTQTVFTNLGSRFTLANPPSNVEFGSITTTSIQINWNYNNNPSNTNYVVERSTDNSTWILVTTTTGSSYNDTGLTPSKKYYYRVGAKNVDNVVTYSYLPTHKYTLANAPSLQIHDASQQTTSQQRWIWSSNGNSNGTDYYAWTTSPSQNSGWTTNTYWTQTGLSPNTQYTFNVKARNGDNFETTSVSHSAYTSIETPTGVNFGIVGTNSIEVRADGTFTNLGSAQSATWTENTNNSSNSNWISDNAYWINSGLGVNQQYCFRSRARNGDGDNTSFTSGVCKYTLANVPGFPVAGSPSTNSINVVINENNNPPHTQFSIYDSVTGKYVQSDGTLGTTEVWRTRSQWGGDFGIRVIGLEPNALYTFKSKARNGNNVETDLSSGQNRYTLAKSVTNLTIDPQTQIGSDSVIPELNPEDIVGDVPDSVNIEDDEFFVSAMFVQALIKTFKINFY